ncbi:MAG: AEC family transporter [Lachnospiraceae bacterium]|nr:AEC family transporter [Lachnospiraceae bacterium]
MVDMSNLLNLQITIFSLMLAGYILTKTGVLSADARKPFSNLLINFILPCNILTSFMMEFNEKILLDCLAILIVSICIQIFVILTSKYYYPGTSDSQMPVLRYGTIVSNAGFMGSPIAQGLYGDQGLLYSSIYLIPMRAVMWSFGVTCFTRTKGKGVIRKILTHPCIVAVLLGMILMITQTSLPKGIEQTIRYAGNANTALSMIVIGNILAEVKASEILDLKAWWFCIVRLLIIPLLVLISCKFTGIDEFVKQVSVVLAGMPAAATTAILAAKYDSDAHFAAKLVFLSTLLSMLSVPLLCILMN